MQLVCISDINPETNNKNILLVEGGAYNGRDCKEIPLKYLKSLIPAEGKTKDDYYFFNILGALPKAMFEKQMTHDIAIILKLGRGEIKPDTNEWDIALSAKERLGYEPKTYNEKFDMANDISFSMALLDFANKATIGQSNPLQTIGDRVRLITELEKAGFIIKRLGE